MLDYLATIWHYIYSAFLVLFGPGTIMDHLGTCDGVVRPALAVAGAGDIPVNISSLIIMIIKVIIII